MLPLRVLLLLLLTDCCWCIDHTYHVRENNDIHTYIGDIVTDTHLLDNIQSQDDNNKLTFNVLQGNTDGTGQLFNVTPGGQLYTAAILDAESLCQYNVECFRILEIAVQHDHSFIKILEIKIMIDDVNDNSPMFLNTIFKLEFYESESRGSRKGIPIAIDKDVIVKNSKITYQLKDNEDYPFKLFVSRKPGRADLLQLILDGNLDRETKDIYNIQLIAKDGGLPAKEGLMDLVIQVADVNDNYPVFSQNVYNITISDKNQMNKPILKLSATDLDDGENGRISYSINDYKTPQRIKEYFMLNEETGQLYLTRRFQFGKLYKLYVIARDNGKPMLSSTTATLFINAISHHNNPPLIDVKFVVKSTGDTAIISEAAKINSFVAYVKVTDNDSGVNGQVECHLQNRYLQLVSMSQHKYKLVVNSEIDRESEKSFNFTIKCQDKGVPPLTVEKQFSMLVTDVNDVQPQFSQDMYKFLTYENEHTHFPVGYINATDPDTGDGGLLSYSLINNGEDILPFQISHVGFISTTKTLDREETDMYQFKVLVKDKGTPSLENTANVVVEVMDVNDNAPYFSFPNVNPFSLDIHYHPHSEHDITVVSATDTDSQHNAFLTYEIVRGNEKHLFTMNPHSGLLSFSRSLYQNDAGLYELELSVKDSGRPVLSSTTTLSLTVTVSNDTSKMMKPSLSTTVAPSNGLSMTVMIVIVIAAVIVSVVVVISISICIVHRLQQTDTNSSSVDMYHKVTPTLNIQSQYMFDPTCVYPGVSYTLGRTKSQPMIEEDIHCRTMPNGGCYIAGPGQKEQMFVPREETMSPGYRELNTSDPLSEMSTLSSHTDSGHGWSVANAGHYEELPDLCRYQGDRTWNRRNPYPHTGNIPREDINHGYHYQPNVDMNTSCYPDPKPFIMNDTTSNTTEYPPPTVAMTGSCSSNSNPPLPSVPMVTTVAKVPSVPQVQQPRVSHH
ncbi:protocadherin beta-15-like [Argonauta hians]